MDAFFVMWGFEWIYRVIKNNVNLAISQQLEISPFCSLSPSLFLRLLMTRASKISVMFGLGAAFVRAKRFNRPNLVVEVLQYWNGPRRHNSVLWPALLSIPHRQITHAGDEAHYTQMGSLVVRRRRWKLGKQFGLDRVRWISLSAIISSQQFTTG